MLAACKSAPPAKPTHTGYYIGGAGLNGFIECGSREMYWATGKASDALQQRHQRLARVPGRPVYVELIGAVQPPGDAVPRGYTGIIRVDSMLPAAPTPPGFCPPPEF
jgi:hypothetical protein